MHTCCNTDARRNDNVSRDLASCSTERECINIDIDIGSATIFRAAIIYHPGQNNIREAILTGNISVKTAKLQHNLRE